MWVKSGLRDHGDRKIWFFTRKDAPKVEEIQADRDVGLTFAEPDNSRYVSVSGRTGVSHDRQKIHDLWDTSLKAWFPDGPDDPNIALLAVDPAAAEYWDTPGSAMVHLYGVVKATLTGESPSPGDQAKVDL